MHRVGMGANGLWAFSKAVNYETDWVKENLTLEKSVVVYNNRSTEVFVYFDRYVDSDGRLYFYANCGEKIPVRGKKRDTSLG